MMAAHDMSLLGPHRRDRVSVSVLLGAAVAGMLVAGMAFGITRVVSRDREDPLTASKRRSFLSYEEAIRPLAREGGKVVQLGMKAGVTDIREGSYSNETLAGMASGWTAEMTEVRRRFGAVPAPSFLAEAKSLYLQALDQYVTTGEVLKRAALAAEPDRASLVTKAVSLGEGADEIYDRAEALLDEHRARFGLT